MTKKESLSDFIGLYPMYKTLKFELIPHGEKTEALLSDNNVLSTEGSFFKNDIMRHEKYPIIKEVLDKYYRYFIDETLSKFNLFDVKEKEKTVLESLFKAYKEKNKEEVTRLSALLRKNISKQLNENSKKYGLNEYAKLLNKQKNTEAKLYTWITSEVENGSIKASDAKMYSEALAEFDKFITYFEGFKQNRENMFSAEANTTAISNRIVNDNLYIFFDNAIKFEKIKNLYSDLAKQLESYGSAFELESYATKMTQAGIDEYNYNVIDNEKEFVKGVNSIINEYRQKHNIKKNALPNMNRLYKQILSESDKKFMVETINSIDEAEKLIKEAYDKAKQITEKADELFKEFVVDINYKEIFVRKNQINFISNKIFKRYDLLNIALSEYGIKQKEEAISLYNLQKAVCSYYDSLDDEDKESIKESVDNFEEVFRVVPKIGIDFSQLKGKELKYYRDGLEQMLEIPRFLKLFYLYKDGKLIDVEKNEDFYIGLNEIYVESKFINKVFDLVRNFATKKSYSKDKIAVFFDKSSFLNSWDLEYNSRSGHLLKKKEEYYLAIIDPTFTQKDKDLLSAIKNEDDAAEHLLIHAQKVDKKNTPRLFIRSKGDNFAPAVEKYGLPVQDILNIYDNKYYLDAYRAKNFKKFKESLIKLIDYFKLGFTAHEDFKGFDLKWKESKEYEKITDFYNDVASCCYKVVKEKVSFSALEALEKQGKINLFKIYNKDFSKYSKGTPNLHTLYWKALFSDENMRDMIFKLGSTTTAIYLRKKSITDGKIEHPRKVAIKNKNSLNAKKTSTFSYDILKNKRFRSNKMFFHCPIVINLASTQEKKLNEKTNRFLENNKDVNIIGIDRGERHLIYYTVINQQGNIVEQGSLNTIVNNYVEKNTLKEISAVVDYQELLSEASVDRDKARKTWDEINNIKNLKDGYLSQVVHKLALLMIKYNAIIALENLNLGFKNSRRKVEKEVYQKFEDALIRKLNYLVFKDRSYNEVGSYAKGYQLTELMDGRTNFTGRQNGVLFYVDPSYTSHICPKTGFVNLVINKLHYKNMKEAKEFFMKLDKISYNVKNDYFEIALDYRKFNIEIEQNNWIICTFGNERWLYNRAKRCTEKHCATEDLKKLFNEYGIDYNKKNILEDICEMNEKSFFVKILQIFRLVMDIRNTSSGTKNENDYILSPVADSKGNFFDSRYAKNDEPQNADANGAYHIALKGLKTMKEIKDGELAPLELGNERKSWFKFVQNKECLE